MYLNESYFVYYILIETIFSFEKNDAPFENVPLATLNHGCIILLLVICVECLIYAKLIFGLNRLNVILRYD